MIGYVGEIRVFAGNFPPRGWAFCDGSLVPISQNTALYAILGTRFGGDGKSTFALPNLKDRAPMHFGAGPGLTVRNFAEQGGKQHGHADHPTDACAYACSNGCADSDDYQPVRESLVKHGGQGTDFGLRASRFA
ncbi:phage tail protein [Brevibacillus gelatini]